MSTSCDGKRCPKRPHYKHHPKWHISDKKCSFSKKWKLFLTKAFKFLFPVGDILKQNTKSPQCFHAQGTVLFQGKMQEFLIRREEVCMRWMSTPGHVGNSIWCLCSAWVRVTCSTPNCSVSQQKQFIFMEIFWPSWKLVLWNCICRREVKDRH